MKLIFLRSAKSDLKELKRYVVMSFGQETWLDSYQKLQQVFSRIAANPGIGNIPIGLEDLNISDFRQVLSGKNRIIYEVRAETAYVHIVCDSRRDMLDLLLRRAAHPH